MSDSEYSSSEPLRKRTRIFQHSMEDLERELDRVMTEKCKLDACTDLFIREFCKIFKDAHRHLRLPSNFMALPVRDTQERGTILDRLRGNINKLLPGYLDGEDTDVFPSGKLLEAIQDRWAELVNEDRLRWLDQDEDKWEPSAFENSLLDCLLRQQSMALAKETVTGYALGTSSLAQTAFAKACDALQASIEDLEETASFACGGSIRVTKTEPVPPVHIEWAVDRRSPTRKLVFPLNERVPVSRAKVLQQLVADCVPASFGRGRRKVVDPEYGLAGKLEPGQFSTNLDPDQLGILARVEETLLPTVGTGRQEGRRIRAELYNLNVYSGPAGLFKKHVDTPRAKSQIGLLVVCLPSPFKGGELIVSHGQQRKTFKWMRSSRTAIQWAAFYSDCEHEIQQVTVGHRMTLTYNLYVEKRTLPANVPVDPSVLQLYPVVARVLQEPGFMRHGGILGIYCSYEYPHSSDDAQKALPTMLKGADHALYSIFRALGVEVDLRPVLDYDDRGGDHHDYGAHVFQVWYLKGREPLHPRYHEFAPLAPVSYDDVDLRWKILLLSRQPAGVDSTVRYARDHKLPVDEGNRWASERVGTELHPYANTNANEEYQEMDEILEENWPSQYLPSIVWINKRRHKEAAFSYIAYGNEPSHRTLYSWLAMLAVIPPFDERRKV